MFDIEAAFKRYADEHGQQEAVELVADINEYTRLYTPNEPITEQMAEPSFKFDRTVLDYNEHFIELSNWGEEKRALALSLALLMFGIFPAIAIVGVIGSFALDGVDFGTILSLMMLVGAVAFMAFLWPIIGAPVFFTALRARYRFNRTTGKVYVLRPARYGGNVVLDWHRVQAHVNWRGRGPMTYDQLRDPTARLIRHNTLSFASLVLYWPPVDANDPERKGEDVLWIGPDLSDGAHWQYIRTFMEEGIDAVPVPNEYEWLRKGYSTPAQNLRESAMHPFIVSDLQEGRDEPSASTYTGFLVQFLWTPLHSLGERLCSWPIFPEEWNSDCGQKRRENGLGPEEPLRWVAK